MYTYNSRGTSIPGQPTMHHRAPTFGLGRLIVALILVYLAQAAYIMDDSDSTIQYHGPFWTQSIGDYLDTSKLFNKTA